MKTWLTVAGLLLIAFVPFSCRKNEVCIGSKKFTESVILGHALTDLAEAAGQPALHYQELGGTRLVFNALVDGSIDAYPEYTGTIAQEIFADQQLETREQQLAALDRLGIAMSQPVGFNNTYAIGLLRERAEELELKTFSDLARYPDLRLGFTAEFMERGDGWPALRKHYGLAHRNVTGLDHDIAYRQLESGTIDVIDVYSTDAKIKKLDLAILQDDRAFFPRYDCVVLYRQDLQQQHPQVVQNILKMQGSIDESQMIEMNFRSEIVPVPEAQVAREFVIADLGITLADDDFGQQSQAGRILQRTLEHLDLVRKSLIPAILVGIPLGIVAVKRRNLGRFILSTTGIILTIPSLALLVLVMPLVIALGQPSVGVGSLTAVVALFLYCLFPIVMSTFTGLKDIEPEYLESAAALGLSSRYRLQKIELPLAARSILSGIRTAAVINVGFATLGALIGAGGYGQPILTGIRRAKLGTILEGAIPAALLAVAVLLLFEFSERWLVPRGLRIADTSKD